ncbi:MAG: YkgJ family cysteine cluster protein [Thermodesulfovibrionales bacterium]|nr:YkgJ family cysteine cluster protein [Thermodesulfovibrionales bacterium]
MGKVPHLTITQCIRCGTCCRKGGPVLHKQDTRILMEGHAGHQHLMTIRKGERAYNPVSGRAEPVPRELVKIIDRETDWTCIFFDEEKSFCSIYAHRFLECSLLQCWDPSQIMTVIGKNTLCRFDLINPGDPIREIIQTHELDCPFSAVENLLSALSTGSDKSGIFKELVALVQKDNALRSYAIDELGMKKEHEFFIFGRPLAQIHEDHGFTVRTHE